MMDALTLRENAHAQLAQIKTLESGVDYLNKVKAIEVWAKAEKKDAELQNMIAEQKIRTQRILGQLLKESDLAKASKGNQYTGKLDQSDKTTSPTLQSFGISKDQSSAFQKIAALPEEVFEREIAVAKEESEKRVELTTSRVLFAAKEYEQQKKKEQHKQDVMGKRVQNVFEDSFVNGDCLAVLETLPNNSIDIVITDPPYGISYKSNRSKFDDAITKRGLLNDGADEAFTLLDKTCKVLSRKCAENSHLYFFCSWSVFSQFEKIISEYFTIKTPIVWDKGNKGSGDLENDWGNQTEIIIFCIQGKKTINYRRGNILSVPRLHSSKMVHPTQKPIELINELLDVSYFKGDFVVDPFMGSGATIHACNAKSIRALGVELDNEMFQIAKSYNHE
jgi:site-specific DNA-methyltransferase (adenine-specific)